MKEEDVKSNEGNSVEEKVEKNLEPRRIRFDLSTVSLGLSVGGFLAAGLIIPPGIPLMLFGLTGLVVGIGGICQRKRLGRKVSGDTRAMGAVVINSLCIVLAFSMLLAEGRRYKSARTIVCASNMHGLGKALLLYASEHADTYPTCDRWCDLLVKHADVGLSQFVCNSAVKKPDATPSHYAMNPDCGPNSPNDVVLLFETKGGWNQFGGPELLTCDNHGGKGANVVFNDGHVEFVGPEDVGKLNWGTGEKLDSVEQGEK